MVWGRELRGGQGCTAHILCFGRGYGVIMISESFSLIVSPFIPPCLVPTAITPAVRPTTVEGRVSAGGDDLPLAFTPIHSFNLPRSTEAGTCSTPTLRMETEAQRSETLSSRSHRLQEQCWNPTLCFPDFLILGHSGQRGERSENPESKRRLRPRASLSQVLRDLGLGGGRSQFCHTGGSWASSVYLQSLSFPIYIGGEGT